MSAGMRIAGALVIAAFVAIGLAAVAAPTDANTGHHQKKLFDERWHYQPNGDYDAWMNLGTSDVWLNCDGDAAACGAKWDGPFTDSMADWNSQPMTVRFDYTDDVQDVDFDVNVYIEDTVPGDPGLLGIGPTYDINGIPCWGPCDVYSGIVWIGDDVHTPPYGADSDRLATLSHEMGHIISLAHESTDPTETLLYDCGMDDTGPIPHSVMAYDCIDPASIGGAGESAVQPWDTCGINHAYNDPAFAFSGCDLTTTTPSPAPTTSPSPTPAGSPTATPTPSPSPSVGASPPAAPTTTPTPTPSPSPTPTPLMQTFVWGDVNCSGGVNPVDSLTLLRFDAGLTAGQAPGCPVLGNNLTPVAALQFSWGDVDCGGGINPVDALKLLRSDAGLSVGKPPGCPEIGSGLPIIVPS